jgi:hypothetical protein
MSYLNFYSANQFPIAQGKAGGPYTLFSSGPGFGTAPIGPHRQAPFAECPMEAEHAAVAHRSANTLHAHRRYGQKPLMMAFYRPNQPMQRGIYANRTSLAGMGDGIDFTDPTTLLVIGGGVLLVAAMLGGHKVGKRISSSRRRGRRRKAARLRTQADLLEL